ncbi:hypothetical protein LGK95_04440 [Clostridium algoriphilum]|uniref:hypothetical protein n=1 Tax=Clostridium algoriphilum TaxID=198347 RepID=UPI001CF3EF99|nr:hypothetical protein [Clostridium algoriphilum]MCB2292785.1 hypothetical protein [Clostridium algoriphilum]
MMSVQTSNSKSSYNNNSTMMGTQNGKPQSNNSFNNMIKIMKGSGFSNEVTAMENRDSTAMNKLVTKLSDRDYKKMVSEENTS